MEKRINLLVIKHWAKWLPFCTGMAAALNNFVRTEGVPIDLETVSKQSSGFVAEALLRIRIFEFLITVSDAFYGRSQCRVELTLPWVVHRLAKVGKFTVIQKLNGSANISFASICR